MTEGPVSCDGEPLAEDLPLTPAELAELDRDIDLADYDLADYDLAGYDLDSYDLAGLDRDLDPTGYDPAGYDLAGSGPDAGQPDAQDGWPEVPGAWLAGVASAVPRAGRRWSAGG